MRSVTPAPSQQDPQRHFALRFIAVIDLEKQLDGARAVHDQ